MLNIVARYRTRSADGEKLRRTTAAAAWLRERFATRSTGGHAKIQAIIARCSKIERSARVAWDIYYMADVLVAALLNAGSLHTVASWAARLA